MNARLTCILGSIGLGIIAFVEPVSAQPAPHYTLPSWDQTLSAKKRFDLVMPVEDLGPQAVLDRETGLVWQMTPHDGSEFEWEQARSFCLNQNTGSRMGWRLPAIEELSTLVDLSTAPPDPALPTDHPFDLGDDFPAFWSTNEDRGNMSYGLVVIFGPDYEGAVPGIRAVLKTGKLRSWCVRGAAGHP